MGLPGMSQVVQTVLLEGLASRMSEVAPAFLGTISG